METENPQKIGLKLAIKCGFQNTLQRDHKITIPLIEPVYARVVHSGLKKTDRRGLAVQYASVVKILVNRTFREQIRSAYKWTIISLNIFFEDEF